MQMTNRPVRKLTSSAVEHSDRHLRLTQSLRRKPESAISSQLELLKRVRAFDGHQGRRSDSASLGGRAIRRWRTNPYLRYERRFPQQQCQRSVEASRVSHSAASGLHGSRRNLVGIGVRTTFAIADREPAPVTTVSTVRELSSFVLLREFRLWLGSPLRIQVCNPRILADSLQDLRPAVVGKQRRTQHCVHA